MVVQSFFHERSVTFALAKHEWSPQAVVYIGRAGLGELGLPPACNISRCFYEQRRSVSVGVNKNGPPQEGLEHDYSIRFMTPGMASISTATSLLGDDLLLKTPSSTGCMSRPSVRLCAAGTIYSLMHLVNCCKTLRCRSGYVFGLVTATHQTANAPPCRQRAS